MIVRFTALLQEAAGADHAELAVDGELSSEDLYARLVERYGAPMERLVRPIPGQGADVVLAVNGRVVPRGRPVALRDEDEVVLLMPLAGG